MLRPLVVYFFLLIGLRLAGKRELAQLSAMDFIVFMTLANTVQNAIIGPDNSLSGGLIGAVTLLVVNYATVWFLVAHPTIDRYVEGKPTVLIDRGALQRGNMARELITPPELEAAAHRQGIASLKDVERAELASAGIISFVSKTPPPHEARQAELKSQLHHINEQLAELRTMVTARG
jgi:uncharacterized membrane protein YcaP (DUF421 family)